MAIKDKMKREYPPRSGLAIGGLGTGSIELRKDGCFYNWNIFNNHPFGTGPELAGPDRGPSTYREAQKFLEDSILFFLVRYEVKGQNPRIKLLQVEHGHYVAALDSQIYSYPWLSGMDRIDYEASFPFSRLVFTDEDMPFDVHMEAFSPFIPHDVKNSSLPAACFRFRIVSKTSEPVKVMLACSLRNGVGYDVLDKIFTTEILKKDYGRVVQMSCDEMDKAHDSWGTLAMASLSKDSTHYTGWEARHPYYEILIHESELPDMDDTAGRNCKDAKTGKIRAMARLWSTLGRSATLKGRGIELEHTFLIGWHFPNLYAATDAQERSGGQVQRRLEGHYYATTFDSAAKVVDYVAKNLDGLEGRTRAFHEAFFDSSAAPAVLNQVNGQLNTFITSAWLTKDMNFGVMEGLLPREHRGPLATIDVSIYGEVMVEALFPELHKSMIRAHVRLANKETGSICHGIGYDFTTHDVREGRTDRLDLPSQFVIMALRGYFWTGDRKYLAEVWPTVKAALEYVLRDRDHNKDLLPDMEGIMCTYDNFPMYGVAAYVSSLWLAALAHAAEAADAAGDAEAGKRYCEILQKAKPVFQEKLWNGRYYDLWNDEGGKHGGRDSACLTDQIIGQWTTHLAGLGGLLPNKEIRTALKNIMALSFRDYGLINCRWPNEGWLHDFGKDIWVDQGNMCWTGVEFAFASFLIYEGLLKEAMAVIENIDRRYGKAGLYFDHQEFGGHYFRAMSAWSIINALAGLSVNDTAYTFAPRIRGKNLKLFFATGRGTGHYVRKAGKKREKISIRILEGEFEIRRLTLGLAGANAENIEVMAGKREISPKSYGLTAGDGCITFDFAKAVTLKPGQDLKVRCS
ncbi:MAG: hypothetical protein HZA50_18005 [Planctomycetes bacterium]|nr:hypothetical protein [Planctomycetota bacterium]